MATLPLNPAPPAAPVGRKPLVVRLLGPDWQLGYLLVLPVLVTVLGLIFYPSVLGVYLSFTRKLIGYPERFIGLKNYADLVQDATFWRAMRNTVVFTTVAVAVKLLIGIAMAVTLRAVRGKNFWTGVLLIPWVTPTVVAALNFLWMFDGLYGVLNWILLHAHILKQGVGWLAQPGTAMASVILVNVWRGFPFFGVTILAGLQGIPTEIYEAAAVDGAHRLQQFRHITLPGIRYVAAVSTLLSTIWTFNDFQTVYILTRGGPGGATHIVGTLTFEYAIDTLNLGKGTAVSVFALPAMALLIWLFTRYMRKGADA